MEIMYIDKSSRRYRSFPLHNHDFWEITVNLAGSGTASVDGQDYSFHKGTIFCVGPGILHNKVSAEGFIDGSLMLQDFIPFGSARVYRLEDDAHGSFQSLFSLAFDIVMKNGPNAQAIINSLADTMYQLLVSWSASGYRNPSVERFQKVLLDNLSNCEFNLAEEIRGTGYSSSYFRKLFKQFTCTSPIGYLNQLRIEYAKRQIQQYFGTRPMKEIAYSCGFEDPYYFSRVFRQYTGENPLRYGKEIGKVKVQKMDGEHLAG
jgi:AraC-like DNA-binding protein